MISKLNLQYAICNLQLSIFWMVLFSYVPSASASLPLTVPIEGKPFAAELAAINEDGTLQFTADGNLKKMPLAELVSWGSPIEPRRGSIVVLADGGILAADVLGGDKDRLEVDSELFGRLKLPLEKLAGVIFRLPGTVSERDRLFDRLVVAVGDADRLLLNNGDELAGSLESLDEKSAKLQTESGLSDVELSRVNAVVFNPQLKGKLDGKSPGTYLGFRDGSRLLVKSFSTKEKSLHVALLNQTWKTELTSLVFIQPLSGRAEYLSQFKPAEYRHVPYLSIAWPYQIDRNVQGGMLRAGGRVYLKGIGMHSAARLNYDLPPGVKRFQAEAAIDDAADEGSVRFRVFVDGKEKFTSPTVRGGMTPLSIDVEVSGGKRLDLVVDYADRADVQDHADWLNARLIMGQAKEMMKKEENTNNH